MVGVSSLPGQLIKFLMEVGLNVQDDWYVIKDSISVLLDYWPYKELDLITLTNKGWFQVALTYLVLDRLAAEIDSDALQQKPCRNQLSEFVMRTSVESGIVFKLRIAFLILIYHTINIIFVYLA